MIRHTLTAFLLAGSIFGAPSNALNTLNAVGGVHAAMQAAGCTASFTTYDIDDTAIFQYRAVEKME